MIRWCLLIWAVVLLAEVQTANKNRVYGGIEINYNKHKYLVFIINDIRSRCSGSILNRMTILTAAHCFNKFSGKFSIQHYVDGEFNKIAEVTNDRVIKHPEYKKKLSNREVDLAIMKTVEKIRFDNCVQPIALLNDRGVQVSDQAIIAGFGRADPTGTPSGREGKVTVTNCPSKLRNVICTFDNVRAASGDSGGALIYRNQLAGVTSGSCVAAENLKLKRPCLSVFANVTANIDWIKSNLKDKKVDKKVIEEENKPIPTEIPTTTSATTDTSSPTSESLRQTIYRSKKHTTYTAMSPIYIYNLKNIYINYLPDIYQDISRTNFTNFFFMKKLWYKFLLTK